LTASPLWDAASLLPHSNCTDYSRGLTTEGTTEIIEMGTPDEQRSLPMVNSSGGEELIVKSGRAVIGLRGKAILEQPLLNKGTAFTEEERKSLEQQTDLHRLN
jgi:hypothetical protein